jgi:hypothetical protein
LRIVYFPMLPIDSSSFPFTITKLTLLSVGLGVGGGMAMLGNLPSLRILKIKWCNDIIDMHVFGGSFPRLEVLQLQDLLQVKEWKQDGSAMPCLRYLVIRRCHCLAMLPPELWSLTALQMVEVEELLLNSTLRRMLQELEMNVSCKIVIKNFAGILFFPFSFLFSIRICHFLHLQHLNMCSPLIFLLLKTIYSHYSF